MTVGELIRVLEGYPDGLRVVVDGYEEGCDGLSPERISPVEICLNTGKHHWEGRHGDPRRLTGGLPDGAAPAEALAFRRASN